MAEILGAVLTGGRSSRFGENKALATLSGRPLISYVIDKLAPQTSDIVFSGDPFDLPLLSTEKPSWIRDAHDGQQGPLVALLSCLKHLLSTETEWLLVSACDTPFLPTDLAEKLMAEAIRLNNFIVLARDTNRLHPANSLWHRDTYIDLEKAINQGQRGLHQFLDTQNFSTVKWDEAANYFFNVNTQKDLEFAEQLLAEKKLTTGAP